MNKKGFTLIELLMVIAIIAIISMILVPNVINMISINKQKSCESLKKNIISATKLYVNENKYELGFDCNVVKTITFQTLIDAGKITGPITNPITKEQVNGTVTVIYNCDSKTFSYEVNGINCNK